MDFITNPDMARAMRRFLHTGGLRFVRAVLLCGSHVRLYGGSLSRAACVFVQAVLICVSYVRAACVSYGPHVRLPVTVSYRADWEPATTSGRRALSVFWRYSAVLWGPSTPNPTQISWKTIILKNWLIYPASCGYVVDWPHVAQVRFWRPKLPHSE